MFMCEILCYSDTFICFFLYAGPLSDDGQSLATTVLMVLKCVSELTETAFSDRSRSLFLPLTDIISSCVF